MADLPSSSKDMATEDLSPNHAVVKRSASDSDDIAADIICTLPIVFGVLIFLLTLLATLLFLCLYARRKRREEEEEKDEEEGKEGQEAEDIEDPENSQELEMAQEESQDPVIPVSAPPSQRSALPSQRSSKTETMRSMR